MSDLPEHIDSGKRLDLIFNRAMIKFDGDTTAVNDFLDTQTNNETYRQKVLKSDEGLEFVIKKMDQDLVNS